MDTNGPLKDSKTGLQPMVFKSDIAQDLNIDKHAFNRLLRSIGFYDEFPQYTNAKRISYKALQYIKDNA